MYRISRLVPLMLLAACGDVELNPADSDSGRDVDIRDVDDADVADIGGDTDAGLGDVLTDPDGDGGLDGSADTVDARADVPGPDVPVTPSDGPQIVSSGSGGLLLRGDLLLPSGVVEAGELLIVDEFIVCVATDCSADPAAEDATVVETHGVISPGLIDAHNHLAYNFLPEWVPPEGVLYDNRYQWADEPSYEEHVRPYTAHRSTNTHFCPGAQWGELRSILHGTTTVMAQSFNRTCTQGLVRNADHEHGLGADHMRTAIGSVRDINDEAADSLLDSFATGTTRYAVHMQEGVMGNHLLEEFDSFAGRDTRNNRHAGTSLVNETSILIHSMSLTSSQFDEIAEAEAAVVWSPSSNLILYGETMDVQAALDRDITLGIAPDWTLSGEDNMLGELAFAYGYARENGISELTSERLWEMATLGGAEVVGLAEHTGRLEEGYRADITVFAASAPERFDVLVGARATDVVMVFIDGELLYGVDQVAPLVSSVNEETGEEEFVQGCEPIDVCGTDRFVCRPPDDTYPTVEAIEEQLFNILEGIGFPENEQYGRGDELLPLVDCAR
jgi:5-methylthioadenosine/S-adenosylhomocysteine deaminase